MQKHFRKIPDSILNKVAEIEGNHIVVEVALRLMEADFNNQRFSGTNFRIQNGELKFNSEYIPTLNKGVYSKRNLTGYKIKYPERPKVIKTYYLGERPIFGDYAKGTFSLYVTKEVIDYDNIPAKELSITTELLEEIVENESTFYIVKISTSEVLDKRNANFQRELLFNLNFLQENIGAVDVFRSEANTAEYIRSLQVNWEIFPPGERNEDVNRILAGVRNLSEQVIREIQERYDFIRNLEPIEIITGTSGMRRYFGARFSDQLVIFENITHGNAVYALFHNWRELSQLSRTEIQTRPTDQYIRVKHLGNWQDKLRDIVSARR